MEALQALFTFFAGYMLARAFFRDSQTLLSLGLSGASLTAVAILGFVR